MNAPTLVTELVLMHAPILRTHIAGNGGDWEEATMIVIESAVMAAYGYDGEQADVFIRTLLERID